MCPPRHPPLGWQQFQHPPRRRSTPRCKELRLPRSRCRPSCCDSCILRPRAWGTRPRSPVEALTAAATPARDGEKRYARGIAGARACAHERQADFAAFAARAQCDRYTVCGSCIIHETLCVWSKCKPLYERRGSLPRGAPDDLVAERQAEADRLRSMVGDLAARVGLRAEDLLDPGKMQRYLRNGLPPLGSPTQGH